MEGQLQLARRTSKPSAVPGSARQESDARPPWNRSTVPKPWSSEGFKVNHTRWSAWALQEDRRSLEAQARDRRVQVMCNELSRYLHERPTSGSDGGAFCKCLPLVQGCLANSFWSGFPLYYVTMGWPLWRCGLAISLGFGLRWPVQLVTRRMGTWAYLPFCFLNLIFAIFAVVFVTEEWAVFCEVVALLAFDATLAVEATAYAAWV
eukprot:g22747.t1